MAYKIEHELENDGTHRIRVKHDAPTEDGPMGNVDRLVFTFTGEGLVIDADENGVIVGTDSGTYPEIINHLNEV